MIEWIRWALLLAGLAAAAWFIHEDGRKSGRTELLVEVQAQGIKDRDAINADLREQLDAGKETAEQERVDIATLAEAIDQLNAKSGTMGAQLRSALHASNLSLCLHPDDVRSVRHDIYEQARSAGTAANQARSALRDDPL